MKKKYHLFFGCVLVFPMLLLISTACNPSVPGELTGGTSDSKDYVITQSGDINYPKDSTLAVEYYTFLIDNNLTERALYFGGLVPSGYDPNQLVVSIECTGLQYSSYYDNYIKSYSLNSKDYYYVPINVRSNKNPGEYTLTARLHKQGFNAIIAKTYTLKVANVDARNWTLDVYQQVGSQSIPFTQEKIEVAFGDEDKMQVSVVVDIKNSGLIEEIVNWDRREGIPYSDNPLVVYAYAKVSSDPPALAIANYAIDHPNNGLLFYIKDYNIINSPFANINGVTFASGSDISRLPVLCFVFVSRMRINFATDWENLAISATSIHELGHLWCQGFTNQSDDQTTHTLWHNSDNKDQCVMIDPYVTDQDGNPDETTQNILNHLGFCEGHLQRGLNVSWVLKQYAPFGEATSGGNQDLFVFNGNTNQQSKLQGGDEIEIEIESSKKDYIKGQFIDVLVKIKNNSNDTIKLYPADHHLYSYEESKTINSLRNTVEYLSLIIPPLQEYVYFVDPLKFINHKKEDKGLLPDLPWYYWPEGDYDYYISYTKNKKTYTSNKISIQIKPVPDSLAIAFEELKSFYPYNQYSPDRQEVLYEKYKGTFYEKEYLYSVLTKYEYYEGIASENSVLRERAVELYKKIILKYPNTYEASLFLGRVYGSRDINESLLREISDSLNRNRNAETLLKVLNNQKKFWLKEINNYGF